MLRAWAIVFRVYLFESRVRFEFHCYKNLSSMTWTVWRHFITTSRHLASCNVMSWHDVTRHASRYELCHVTRAPARSAIPLNTDYIPARR